MLKIISDILSSFNKLSLSSQFTTHNSVRHYAYGRKPIWLGTAPSKKFRVPPRKRLPVAEKMELDRLVKNYKSAHKAMYLYHAAINAKQSVTSPEVIEEQKILEEEDWKQSNLINDAWNAEVAAEREQRIAKEKEEKRLRIITEKEERMKLEKEELEKADELVRLEMEKSKHYITKDNIDEQIERVLSTEVDYNFAIDIKENIYAGRRNSPHKPKEEATEKQAVEN